LLVAAATEGLMAPFFGNRRTTLFSGQADDRSGSPGILC